MLTHMSDKYIVYKYPITENILNFRISRQKREKKTERWSMPARKRTCENQCSFNLTSCSETSYGLGGEKTTHTFEYINLFTHTYTHTHVFQLQQKEHFEINPNCGSFIATNKNGIITFFDFQVQCFYELYTNFFSRSLA